MWTPWPTGRSYAKGRKGRGLCRDADQNDAGNHICQGNPHGSTYIFQKRTENNRWAMQFTVCYCKAQGCVMVNRTICDTPKGSSPIVASDYAKITSTRRNNSSDYNRKAQRHTNPKSLDVQQKRQVIYRRLISIYTEKNTKL
jgi:hypothetical protein